MLKVLFVEDDRPLHETFDFVLSDRCTLLSACTGAEDLEVFEREAPDVVLLDIHCRISTASRCCVAWSPGRSRPP